MTVKSLKLAAPENKMKYSFQLEKRCRLWTLQFIFRPSSVVDERARPYDENSTPGVWLCRKMQADFARVVAVQPAARRSSPAQIVAAAVAAFALVAVATHVVSLPEHWRVHAAARMQAVCASTSNSRPFCCCVEQGVTIVWICRVFPPPTASSRLHRLEWLR